jgi:hypothetical protein
MVTVPGLPAFVTGVVMKLGTRGSSEEFHTVLYAGMILISSVTGVIVQGTFLRSMVFLIVRSAGAL